MSDVLKEAKRLHDLGLAIHWLKARDKRPVGSWHADSRAEWSTLKSTHSPTLNVGVKLGRASQLATGFLACLDCDVKSEDPAHRAEMEKRLEQLVPQVKDLAPCVSSGRGLGSRHLYGVTSSPVKKRTLAESTELTRVKMPSAGEPSKSEKEILSADDLKKGIRLRKAWQIELMSQGQQMALPPSIHPDSGRAYVWDRPLLSASDLPSFDCLAEASGLSSERRSSSSNLKFHFNLVDVDLVMDPRVSQKLLEDIVDTDCPNYSDRLMSVSNRMVRAGFSDDEILSVLTDPSNRLGECAYLHTVKVIDIKFRDQAARWLWTYTVKKSRDENSAEANFQAISEETPLLPNDELDRELAASQVIELAGAGEGSLSGWESQIARSGQDGNGPPKSSLKNVMTILQGAIGPDIFRKNRFTGFEVVGRNTPWGALKGSEIGGTDLNLIKAWLAENFRFEPATSLINEAVSVIAERNPFHPVRDYLNGLEWDGESRIDSWLKTYMNAKAPEPYLSAISRKILCAMVARVLEPGRKFDSVLIFEGKQGIGKSTAIRKLVGEDWFSDAHIEIKDKDAILAMRGVWGFELGELSSMRKADVDQLKEFLSRKADRIRVPYGHRTELFPRQCVFIGTTNNSEYFRDLTGNRRFWPIETGECDWDGIEAARDQFFAEAKWFFELGEELYLHEREAAAGAFAEQEKRVVHDIWIEELSEAIEREKIKPERERLFNPEAFTMREVFGDNGPLAGQKSGPSDQNRAGGCLRKLGFRVVFKRVSGKTTRVWENVTRDI